MIATVLIAAAAHLAAATETVKCVYDLVNEDFADGTFDKIEAVNYGVCRTRQGRSLHIGDWKTMRSFRSGDELTLTVRKDDSATGGRSSNMQNEAKAMYELNGEDTYTVLESLTSTSAKARPESRTTDARSVLVIRMIYDDSSPDYCPMESCVKDGMYDSSTTLGSGYLGTPVTGTTASVISESSYGSLTFDKGQTTFLDVRMEKTSPTSGCPTYEEMWHADVKAEQQFGVEANTFRHREYFVPLVFGRCSFSGLANVGCQNPATQAARVGRCWSIIRGTHPTLRAHEFGHNFGLFHGGLDPDDYGDQISVMGNDRAFRAYTAPDRDFLGWIPSEFVRLMSPQTVSYRFTLHALHELPQPGSGQFTTVKFWCDSCQSQGVTGGHVYLSFLTPQGHYSQMSSLQGNSQYQYANKVYVHLQRRSGSTDYGRGTARLAVLGNGGHSCPRLRRPLDSCVPPGWRHRARRRQHSRTR